MRLLLAFVLYVLVASGAQAKCPFRFLRVAGNVVDSSGAPVRGALVGVAWTQDEQLAGPALATTDSEGRYSIRLRIESFSGQSLLGGDKCKSRIDTISVAAAGKDYRSEHAVFAVGELEELQVRPLRLDVPVEEDH